MSELDMKNFRIGIEIEGILNRRIHSRLNVAEYHEGRIGNNKNLTQWKVEKDGSLHATDNLTWREFAKPVEIISGCLESEEEFADALNEFQIFISKNNKHELKDVMNFNHTCGCHISFSIRNFRFSERTYYEIYPVVREEFKRLILESNIQNKQSILNQYDREYARLLTKEYFLRFHPRNCEFNFTREDDKGRIEWRSVNLRDIQTWAEFREFFDIVYECLTLLYNLSIKWQRQEDYKPRILTRKIKDDIVTFEIKLKESEKCAT